MTYNFTLTAENKLGKKSVNFNFDVAHRGKGFSTLLLIL